MLAFGHFVLPLAAIVALGLLFVGIKLFFLTPGDRGGIEVAPPTPVATEQDQDIPPTDSSASGETGDTGTSLIATADPVSADAQTTDAAPGGTSQAVLAGPIGGGANTQATRPSGGTPATPATTTPAEPPAPSRPRVSPNVRWGVQIGAFQKEEGAKTLMDEVTKAGYTASISTAKNSSGTTFHRVRVAAGNNRDDAAKLAVELEKKGYPVLVVSN